MMLTALIASFFFDDEIIADKNQSVINLKIDQIK